MTRALTRFGSYTPLSWWRGEDSNLRRQSRQIYSLIPLAAREPLPKCKPLILLTKLPDVNTRSDARARRSVLHRLGLAPERIQLRRRELGEVAAVRRKGLLHMAKARLESPVGATQRGLRIDLEVSGEIGDCQ